jgi:hypothetical protein
MERALDFWRRTSATDAAIAELHRTELARMEREGAGLETLATGRSRRRIREVERARDGGTRAMGLMTFSKAAAIGPEPLTVVEMGGTALYERAVHAALATTPPRTPEEWKKDIFEKILEQPLKGGELRVTSDDLLPMTPIEGDD